MRKRAWRSLVPATVAGLVLAGALWPQDPPHWASTSVDIDCTSQCHVPHQSLGDNLTSAASNANLCQSCHNPAGLASDLAISNAHKAIPGESGSSHAFEVPGVNGALGTQLPLDPQMSTRTPEVLPGVRYLICSTCHNQHRSEAAFGGSPRISAPRQVTALGSTGTLSSGGAFTGPQGVWYLVEITQAGDETSARFQFSKDNGTSFFPEKTAGAGVTLDSGVTVTFGAGSYVVGERWEFSAAYPFLRATLDAGDNAVGSRFCRDCHRSWVMDHGAVETWDGGLKSHPVGVALGANGRGYDRSAPLDGNGVAQGSVGTDANPTNDLLLDASGNLQCLTCHGVHFVDSNTLTVDQP